MSPTWRHRLLNIAHSILLIAGMTAIVWICASVLFGTAGAIWAIVGIGILLLLSPSLPSDVMLSLYNAKRVNSQSFPEGIRILDILADRAELKRRPDLYYLPSSLPNAFTVGRGEQAAIAVSDGMLRLLNQRELTGVLAHEISHMAHRDLWIMGLADGMARFTTITSYVGQFLLLLNLPLILMGEVHIPWIAPLILIFSPTIMSLLQLALSRAREFNADLGAARLTGDPMGLASALGKLERSTGRFWEEMLFPGRRIPEPSLLRTHPRTEDRIDRLKALEPDPDKRGELIPSRLLQPSWPRIGAPPRWRRTGVWY